MLDESDCRAKKILVNRGSEFYNRSMKAKLECNVNKNCSTHHEEKSIVADQFR